MMFDKNKTLSTILSSRRKPDGSTVAAPMKNETTMTEDGNQDPRHMAAQDILRAMDAKSPQMLMEAMANFHDLHASRGEEPEPEAGPKTES